MKIENIYVIKMFIEDDRLIFTLETSGYERHQLGDNSTKFRAEISSSTSSDISTMLVDKMRDRKPITIEVN